jgi:hypothetical protein
MTSCEKPNIKELNAIMNASKDTLSNIYINSINIKSHNPNIFTSNNINGVPIDKYNPNTDTGFTVYSNLITTYSNINLNLDDKNLDDILNNGKYNLFTYENENENENENEIKIKSIYANCAAITGSKWFTSQNISNISNICGIDKNIELPSVLEYNQDKSSIYLNFASKDPTKTAFCPYESNVNNAYCENRWYDWIITPNYYLGNTYYKDIGKYTSKDIYKCYKPCDGDSMPYTNQKGEYQCIAKKYYANGIFSNKPIFSPIGLINLIGNFAMYDENNYENSYIYILHQLILKYNLNTNVDYDIYKINSNLQKNINNKSEYDNIHNEIKNSINVNILKKFDYSSKNQKYEYRNFFSYKHPYFNENDSELYTLKGLDANNLLIDPILFHTWVLANIFKPINIDNVSTTITDINTNNLTNTLYYKLNYFLNDKYKATRLKNIFFKAVNICYDNKTDFSKNIIKLTKDSFNSISNLNYKLIQDIDTISSNEAIENFKENHYYNKEQLNELIYSINSNKYLYDNLASKSNKPLHDDNKYLYLYSVEELEDNGKDSQLTPVSNQSKTDDTNKKGDILDDEFNIPNFSNIILLFLRIILVIIILYILYIFYDIFGESISIFINNIYVNIYKELFNEIYRTVKYSKEDPEYWRNIADVNNDELYNVESKIQRINQIKIQEN